MVGSASEKISAQINQDKAEQYTPSHNEVIAKIEATHLFPFMPVDDRETHNKKGQRISNDGGMVSKKIIDYSGIDGGTYANKISPIVLFADKASR